MYRIEYTKPAVKDIQYLKAVKLDKKAKALIEILRIDPYQTPPRVEKLQEITKALFSKNQYPT